MNKANSTVTEVVFLDLHLFISNGFVPSKIYANAMILILISLISRFLDDDVPRAPSCGVYISQLIRFSRLSTSSHLANLNVRNKTLTAKLLQQGYRYQI